MDVFPGQETRRRWPRVVGLVAAGVVVLAGAYVVAAWAWSDRVPPGTTVAGVEIGGQGTDDAVTVLEESLAAATTDPVPVAMEDRRTTVLPGAAGLSLDARGTVESVTGLDLHPAALWHQLFGAGPVEPVTVVDDDALDTALGDLAADLVTEPVNGTVVLVDGAAESTPAQNGTALDEAAARDVLVSGWLTAPRPVQLPSKVVEPEITQDEVDEVVDGVARRLVAAPVVVSVAGQIAELPVDVLAAAASFVPRDGELELRLDGEQLVEAVTARTTDLFTSPSDATFAFDRTGPVIVPGVPGTTLDPEILADAVADAATGSNRTAEVELTETDPEETTEALEALGVTEIVSEFSTPLTSEPRRTKNIVNGAEKINGILVRPGEVFSLTEALGPLDAEHGFVQAGAIVGGEHTDAWGGGLSQVSTTTYNAAFFAGFEDVEHSPHSEYFRRYPEGREATIFTGVIDLKWRNDTPYGALVQAWVADGRMHVRIWGTPYWTVETSTTGRSRVVAPKTVYSQSPTCTGQSAGNPGFQVTVHRKVLLGDEVHSDESWTVRYRPQNRIVCGSPPAPDAEPAVPAAP